MTQAAPRQAAKPAGRRPVSGLALWLGLALGTFLAVAAVTHGVMLPGFGGFLDAVLTFVLFLAVGVVLAELTRRHHRAALEHGWRYGRRGGRAAARHARGAGSCPGRRCPVTPVAHPAHRRAAGQVGRTRRACRAGAGRPSRGQ